MFGLIAGAAWGLAFLIPNILSEFTSLEITIGRYFMYGLYSILLFFVYKKSPFHISPNVWLRAMIYAFIGNVGYFFFLVSSIKYAGATVTTLMIGTLPLVISFFGNLLNREFPFRIMIIPAISMLIGVFLLFYNEQINMSSENAASENFLLGFICCLIAIILWTSYAISNANFLKRETEISSDLFATIVGIQTFVLVALFLLISWITDRSIVHNVVTSDSFIHYMIGVILLGIIASWIATWAWNQTSIRLSVTMAGMVIVFETLFGLLYSFIYYFRWPTVWEWTSIIFIVFGVTIGIWKINGQKPDTLHQQ